MWIAIILSLLTLAVAALAAFRPRPIDWGPLERTLDKPLDRVERALREEIARSRAETAMLHRHELETLRASVEGRLDQMRLTVDEKLQGTLERRLGESFRLVSDRLEQVHRGLGEMQSLAVGVGDLKKMLGNVKLRGGWGEVQLGLLLEQMLGPEQISRNWRPNALAGEAVEYAIRLPGRQDGEEVMLPIDAKLPTEDWLRFVGAAESGDHAAAEQAGHRLELRIRQCARDISSKYLVPPRTTDFAIMFLPVEGLYAEVIRRPELIEQLQRELRVMVAGPTTLAALLSSLQMGFRTLAVQRRSSEVWALLGAVKTEFGRFGHVLEGVRCKLEQATETMDKAAQRSRVIERKLRSVEELPAGAEALLTEDAAEEPEEDGAEVM
jgi:DNA recombination protein RmuC